MRNFYVLYRDDQKLQPLVAEISWTKNLVIMEKCKDDLEREFYILMTRKFGWTKNVLINQVENKTYQQYLLNQTSFDKVVPEKYRSQAKLAVKDEYTFELKIGKFLPEYAGKMQFYLSALDDKVRLEDENPSIGIVVCKSKNRTVVEYTLKDVGKPIGVSTYKILKKLPEDLSKYLPSGEEIAEKLKLLEEIGSDV